MSKNLSLSDVGSVGVQLGLIITPMLDMSFQLLAFFIMTYHPSALEGHIPGSLVPGDVARKGKELDIQNPELPSEDDFLPIDSIRVQIKAIAKGQEAGSRLEGYPSQIFLQQ